MIKYNESEILNKQKISIKQKSFSDNLVVEENSMHQVQEVHSEGIQRRKYSCEIVNSSRKRSVSINLPIQRRMSTNEQQSEETSYNSYTEMNSVYRQSDEKNHSFTNTHHHHPHDDITSSSGQLRHFLNRLDNVSIGCTATTAATTTTTKDDTRLDEKNTDDEITEELEDDDIGVQDISTGVNCRQIDKLTLNNGCHEPYVDVCKSIHGNRLARVTEVNESDFDTSDDRSLSDDDDDEDIDTDTEDDSDDSSESDSFVDHSQLKKMRADLEEELGFELLLKAYNVIQALQEDEDETITESEQIVTNVLGEEKTRIYYDRIVQLVLADGVYMDDE
ncbi:Serine/threonine-protein kinase Nek1 [Schistosoma japonicum]|nr:Serine/threonine-protein kinase Nek1 [Schistosoma japonicum]